MFVLIWVDDILYFSNEEKMAFSFKSDFQRDFSLEDRGLMSWFLGCIISQSTGRKEFSQKSYVLDILAKGNMSECKPTSTPAMPSTKQSKNMVLRMGHVGHMRWQI